MGRKRRASAKSVCKYCDKEFEDDSVLLDHQKARHYKCILCNKRLNSVVGLYAHMQQVHKEVLKVIPNALPGREKVSLDDEEEILEPDDPKRLKLNSHISDGMIPPVGISNFMPSVAPSMMNSSMMPPGMMAPMPWGDGWMAPSVMPYGGVFMPSMANSSMMPSVPSYSPMAPNAPEMMSHPPLRPPPFITDANGQPVPLPPDMLATNTLLGNRNMIAKTTAEIAQTHPSLAANTESNSYAETASSVKLIWMDELKTMEEKRSELLKYSRFLKGFRNGNEDFGQAIVYSGGL